MQGSYLGSCYSTGEIERVLSQEFIANQVHSKYFKFFDDLCEQVSKLLAQGKVVGWFQGSSEWGPRALGNRSILGDPRNPALQKQMNSEN